MFANGHGVAQDYAEAMKWYRKAAEKGDPEAEARLGLMYHDGESVPQEYSEGVEWNRKASEQGYAPAQRLLARLYQLGPPTDYFRGFSG
jgi:uncharacterized protein